MEQRGKKKVVVSPDKLKVEIAEKNLTISYVNLHSSAVLFLPVIHHCCVAVAIYVLKWRIWRGEWRASM
jgi:hypothetical protein